MSAIAWAIVWVAVWYAPDVHRATHGTEASQGAMAVWFGVLLFSTIALIGATFSRW